VVSLATARPHTRERGTELAPQSVPALCLAAALDHGKQDALNFQLEGTWQSIDCGTFVRRVRHLALGLHDLGIKPGDRVALVSENRPEWSIADLAILSLGAVNVPIYTTQAVDQIRFILADSGARALFVSGRKVFRHVRPALEGWDRLEKLVFFDAEAAQGQPQSATLAQLEATGAALEEQNENAFEEVLRTVSIEQLATIIYTSGTTGEPKGVMLSHGNFVSNVLSIAETLPISATDVALSVLPLSHIFERIGFYVFCYCGVSVYYSPSFEQLGEHLKQVRPTVMTAVPRLFEKVYHRIVKKGLSQKGWKRRVFLRALNVARRYGELQDKRLPIPRRLRLQHSVVNRLVFAKWREGVGGRLRYFVSGGAPLSPALSYAFWAGGIPILQGYGATETCIVSANRPENNHVGSVGPPFPGIELATAPDGEILVRGPNVMRGYYGKAEATAAVLRDGWFATGDVGHLDPEGRLYITDRKKDLFKLSNGKYVAPQLIESLLKQSGFVSQAVVVGSSRKQPVALIVPDWDALKQAMKEAGEEIPESREDLSRHPAAVRLVQRDIAALTKQLADYERIRRIALLPDEFSIDRGELTPTLKVKRRVIDEKYGDLIDELYA
jgi:long-chain acyl-CoA synthetase